MGVTYPEINLRSRVGGNLNTHMYLPYSRTGTLHLYSSGHYRKFSRQKGEGGRLTFVLFQDPVFKDLKESGVSEITES